MTDYFCTHPSAGRHQTPAGHPEQRARYSAVMTACQAHVDAHWHAAPAPKATYDQLCRVHSPAYLDALFADLDPGPAAAGHLLQLDADTYAGPDSLEAGLRGAGGACWLVDQVMERDGTGFSAMRPPGHHAEPDRAMGFCLFSSAAVAACHAQAVHGAGRVAVLDFDVHHGNGTQAAFWGWPDLFYVSSHQMPHYPGTGAADEVGAHDNIINLPLAAGTGGAAVLAGWRDHLLPAVARARPDLIIVSAGFDAHEQDPLGSINMTTDDFATLTADIAGLAADCCGGRIVSVLEGGYHLDALGASVLAHLRALKGL